MQPFSIVHEYEGSPEDFWALFFDDAYNRAFYAAVDIDFDIVREQRDGPKRERIVRYRSRKPASGMLRAFLPEGLGYTEHGLFDAEARTFEHRIEPNGFGSRTDIHASLVVEDLGAGRIRRTYAGTVAIRAPLIAQKLERETVAGMQVSQETAAAVTREWLARRQKVAEAVAP
jgi:hypothetical protein